MCIAHRVFIYRLICCFFSTLQCHFIRERSKFNALLIKWWCRCRRIVDAFMFICSTAWERSRPITSSSIPVGHNVSFTFLGNEMNIRTHKVIRNCYTQDSMFVGLILLSTMNCARIWIFINWINQNKLELSSLSFFLLFIVSSRPQIPKMRFALVKLK